MPLACTRSHHGDHGKRSLCICVECALFLVDAEDSKGINRPGGLGLSALPTVLCSLFLMRRCQALNNIVACLFILLNLFDRRDRMIPPCTGLYFSKWHTDSFPHPHPLLGTIYLPQRRCAWNMAHARETAIGAVFHSSKLSKGWPLPLVAADGRHGGPRKSWHHGVG